MHRPLIVLGIILAAAGLGLTQWVRSDLLNRPAGARQEAWEVGPRVVQYDPKPASPKTGDARLDNPEEWFGPSTPKRHTPRYQIAALGWASLAAGLGFAGVGVTRRRQLPA